MPTSTIPEWVESLSPGDLLAVVFPHTKKTMLAKVVENNPTDHESIYFGTIVLKYSTNNYTTSEELLYDDYSNEDNIQHSWYAHRIT